MSDFIDSRCPHCGAEVSFPAAVAGLVEECPHCWQSLVVPDNSEGTARKVPIPITTPRLLLRPLRNSDANDLLEFMSDTELFRHTQWETMDESAVYEWLKSKDGSKLTTLNESVELAIELRDNHKIIGLIRLSLQDAVLRRAWFEILVSRPWQRQGIGTEAVSAIFDFFFAGIDQDRVVTSCDSRNVAAGRLLLAVGMRREGEFVKDNYVNGEWINTTWYAVLREEYLARKEHLAPPRPPAG